MSSSTRKVISVVGATGNVGSEITTAFLDKKTYTVRVVARPDWQNKEADKKSKILSFQQKGAHIVEADLSDTKSIVNALKGTDVVICALSGAALGLQIAVIEAAKQAGVKRFVPSEFGMDITKVKEFPLLGGKLQARTAIEASGMEWTYIITGYFLDTTFTPFLGTDLQKHTATIFGDGNAKVTLTLIKDFCQIIPDIIENPASKNATLNIIG